MVTLFSMMGAAALLLSQLGLYVLQRHLTLQRLPEAGLRMALGATPDRVRRGFLRALAWPMGLGLSLGLGGTVVLWRILGSRITTLPGLHPGTLAWVSGGLAVIGLLGALLPLACLDRSTPSALLRDPASGES
jgi:ABC-type antimicrobial peptide transport system permease subunit